MTQRRAQDVWRIRFSVPAAAVPAFEAAVDPFAEAVLCFEIDDDDGLTDDGTPRPWLIDAYAPGAPDMAGLRGAVALAAVATGIAEPALEVEHQPARDWLAENLITFAPIRAGRFFVHGSHHTERAPWGSLPMVIDAATAFGSGEHQSTYGCLLALDDLAKRGGPLASGRGRGLDMGCGSGILAMAMARAWKVPVLATDIDPESVRVARFNAVRNGLGDLITCLPGDGFKGRAVSEAAPYDLICANILARPLSRMAKDVAATLAPGGRVILAGLLTRQEAMVLSAYRAQGLVLERHYRLRPWSTLVLAGR